MTIPLNALIIEDSDSDAALNVRVLEAAGYKVAYEVVTTAAAMKAALKKQTYDVILADHNLPQFDSLKALVLLKKSGQDIPFIVVSGVIGEEAAATLMRTGAHDYVMKDKLARLAPAVARELNDAKIRRDRNQAEAALSYSETKHRTLVENLPQKIFHKDRNSVYVTCNENYARDLKILPDEITGKTDFDFFPSDLAEKYRADDKRVMKLGSTEELEEKYIVNGKETWVQTVKTPVKNGTGEITGLIGIFSDITERKQLEQELQESRTSLIEAQHIAHVGSWDWNILTDILSYSDEFHRIFGQHVRNFETFLDSLHPDDRELVEKSVNEALGANKPYNIEYHIILPNEEERAIYARGRVIFDSAGKPVRMIGTVQDITERKQAEGTLRIKESAITSSINAIALADLKGNLTYVNPAFLEMWGFSENEEVLGEPSANFWQMQDKAEAIIETLRSSGKWRGELIARRKDGSCFDVQLSGNMVIDEKGNPLYMSGAFIDITERRQAEERLWTEHEKLEKTLNDAISTMSKIVEMRDPYTSGHQQKVAELALAIARGMNMDDDRIKDLQKAAVIHDIGKIYVPSDILSKPSKLNEIEFNLIKTHPQGGYDIVKGMDFPCIVAQSILQHHERLDGSGYPNGLKDEEISHEAKILAVADVVEAMSSHRPYRPALGIDKALEEITQNKGKLYDPDVVDACLKLFNEKGFKFEQA